MSWLPPLLAVLVLAFHPGWGFLLDPPWCILTFAVYLLWEEVFDR